MMWWHKATALLLGILGTVVVIEVIIANILKGTNL